MKTFYRMVAALAATVANAAIEEHLVTSLPGYDGELPSKHYSGYLPVGKTSGVPGYIHYWYIESESDPTNDPLVYWTNGGPGGSGINAGLLTEMGQMHVNDASFPEDGDNSTGLKVFYNPYSWSQVANTVYVSQPKGVGFSYCADSVAESDCVNDDQTAAQDAYDFFVAFFEGYPELKPNDFYLTAESYGGIYIPTFMREIDERGGVDNFKGAAIGDGCWGTDVGLCAFGTGKSNEIQANFFNGHSMIPPTLFATLSSECTNSSSGEWYDDNVAPTECRKALEEMSIAAGTYDVYNVYDTCGAGDRSPAPPSMRTLREWRAALFEDKKTVTVGKLADAGPHPQLNNNQAAVSRTSESSESSEATATFSTSGSSSSSGGGGRRAARALAAVNDYPCGGDRAASAWLGQEDVAAALHVNLTMASKGMTYIWGPSEFSGDLRPLYAELLQKYRMMIYSGDTDACVPFWGTEQWVRELGLPVKEPWHQWVSPLEAGGSPQRAGYAIDYDANDFKFVTVQGAGHMVPTYKPYFALTLITKFLNNESF